MGVVYQAQHLLLAQRVALKMMLPDSARSADAVGRFLNEARAVARLENEHVARVMDVGTLPDGTPYLVMELLEGADLATLVREGGAMPVERVVDYLLEAMEAVAEAHAAGIIHRDLKPSNLFLAQRKGGSAIKVLDFGISKTTTAEPRTDAIVTATNAVLGSPAYMSPEQLRNARTIDVRADLWSLGVIGYQLLTGVLPFNGSNIVELFAAIQEREPRSIRELAPDVPPAVDAALLRCLERDAAARFASVLDLGRALVPFGSLAARASLARIAQFAKVPASVPPQARITIDGANAEELPHATFPAWLAEAAPMAPSPAATSGIVVAHGREPWAPSGSTRRWTTAAAIVVAALACVGAFFLGRGRPSPAPSPVATASAPLAVPEEPASSAPPPPTGSTMLPVPSASAHPETSPPPSPRRHGAATKTPPSPKASASPSSGVPSEWN
jgi:serine/threonine-protein kinase